LEATGGRAAQPGPAKDLLGPGIQTACSLAYNSPEAFDSCWFVPEAGEDPACFQLRLFQSP